MKKSKCILNGRIRIIGGQWKRRKLPVLSKQELRPTTNQVRETLFNWLESSIKNSHCLDCFAGSGLLGIEALSRYAFSVTLLEIQKEIAQQIKQNLSVLKAVNAKVINIDTLAFLKKPGIPYEIVFVDPPFHKGLIINTLKLLEKNGWLANNAFIYVESEIKNDLNSVPVHWKLYRKKTTKKIIYQLYHRKI